MLRGVATATTQLVAESKQLESLAANLADVNTPGYRQDQVDEQSFGQLLVDRIAKNTSGLGSLSLGPVLSHPRIDLSPGPVEETGRPLDAALTSDGLFVVRSPNGLLYTRRGAFHQDGNGQLVSLEGWPVLGQNGPISANAPLSIGSNGQVLSGARVVGQLRVEAFPATTTFGRQAGTYLVPQNGAAGQVIANPDVLGGHLEGSNVDLTTTMTDIMAATRSYQAAQQALLTQNKALSTLIQQVNGQ